MAPGRFLGFLTFFFESSVGFLLADFPVVEGSRLFTQHTVRPRSHGQYRDLV